MASPPPFFPWHARVTSSTYGMCVDDVFQHVVHGSLGCIALSIITPSARGRRWRQGRAIRQPAAQRLVALGVRALLVVGVEVRVRDVQDLWKLPLCSFTIFLHFLPFFYIFSETFFGL